jgi:galactokinase
MVERDREREMEEAFAGEWCRKHWHPSAPAVVTRAPARLDVMGGIADYSGSLVLELPLREATWIALQRDERLELSLVSSRREREDFTMRLADLSPSGEPSSYETARAYFQRRPETSWAAYVAGAFLVLMREKNRRFSHGARIFIHSNVPEGKGVGSSAAVEVAAMTALDAAYEIGLERREVAALSQNVENQVVGAPCGVMDQMTSACGEENRLLALLCQPAEILGQVELPGGLAFWGVDSGVAHQVSGADYRSVRIGTFMGYRILQSMAETDWNGYLANLSPSELEQKYLSRLPESMTGSEFLDRFERTADGATAVDPSRTYPVRLPTAHPVREHFRVRTFARLLEESALDDAPLLGELMYQSHASYSACGLGSAATDRLVELARESGPSRGIFGAKITGGGSGGTVAILGRRDAEKAVRAIARRYGEETGAPPYLFAGSSPGAASFGHRRIP